MSIDILEILRTIDLDELQQQIDAKREERAAIIRDMTAAVDALEMSFKLASVAQNGKKPRRAETQAEMTFVETPKRAAQTVREQVGKFLQTYGPATSATIARELGFSHYKKVTEALSRNKCFERAGGGTWKLVEVELTESDGTRSSDDVDNNDDAAEAEKEIEDREVEEASEPSDDEPGQEEDQSSMTPADRAESYLRLLGKPSPAMTIGQEIGLSQPKDMAAILSQDVRFVRVVGGFWRLA